MKVVKNSQSSPSDEVLPRLLVKRIIFVLDANFTETRLSALRNSRGGLAVGLSSRLAL